VRLPHPSFFPLSDSPRLRPVLKYHLKFAKEVGESAAQRSTALSAVSVFDSTGGANGNMAGHYFVCAPPLLLHPSF
jgi:hypothetical protein